MCPAVLGGQTAAVLCQVGAGEVEVVTEIAVQACVDPRHVFLLSETADVRSPVPSEIEAIAQCFWA
jgi:hypothetical protein